MASEGTRSVETEAGVLQLTPATEQDLSGLARDWPLGLVRDPAAPGSYGLVVRFGDRELHGVKLQPPDLAESDARIVSLLNRALIAAALPRYLEKGHRGVLLPCAYHRLKGGDRVESGIAFFVGPHADSRPRGARREDQLHDRQLGEGATAMIYDMAGAIAGAAGEHELPMQTVIGVDVRPMREMGHLAVQLLVSGDRVLVATAAVDPAEPVWQFAVRAGFESLPQVALRPVAVPDAPPDAGPAR